MKRIQTIATALALSTALCSTAIAATKVGVIGVVNSQVYATSEDGTKRQLSQGDAVYLNDQLSTSDKGAAQVMFLDKSALTISPNSLITIDKFVYDPAKKDGSMALDSAKGAFRFIGGALTKKKAVNIKTPISTIGIRGGIVDTHIAEGGQTDAVFLFGKEMTVTNGAGETTSTTSFGTGFGINTASATPVALPQNVIAARMSNSPTQAAVRAAPPANPETLQKIDSKIQDTGGAAGKAADTTATPPVNDSGTPPPPPANSGGGNNGASNNTQSPAGQGGPFVSADSESQPPAAPQTANAAPAAPSSAAQTPVAAPAISASFAAGAGLKPAVPAAPIAKLDAGSLNVGANAQEQLRSAIDVAVNEPTEDGSTPNNNRSRFAALNERIRQRTETRRQQVNDAAPTPTPTTEPVAAAPVREEETTEEIIIVSPPNPTPAPAPAPAPLPWLTANYSWNPADPTSTPTAPVARDYVGRAHARTYDGVSVATLEHGDIEAYDATADTHGPDRYVFAYRADASLGLNGADQYVLGSINRPTSTGFNALSADDVRFEDRNGIIDVSNAFDGFTYTTAGDSFAYYQLAYNDATNSDNIAVRGLFTRSILLSANNAGEAINAYSTALLNAQNVGPHTQNITEYDFLPQLQQAADGSDNFGRLSYNHIADLDGRYGSAANESGLFVNWQTQRVLGGYVNFGNGGGNATAEVLFGKINDSISAGISGDPTTGFTGSALNAVYYDLDQGESYTTNDRDSLSITSPVGSFSADDTGAIEAFAIDATRHGPANTTTQALVVDTTPSTAIENVALTAQSLRGFSAGIATDSANNIARISTGNGGSEDVSINIHADGTVGGGITYTEREGVGSFVDGRDVTVSFGATSGDQNAALQNDLYAAEINGDYSTVGNESLGVIVSADEALAPTSGGLVCSSCSFAHWGVWQVDHINSGTPEQQTALVPYVAGQLTTDSELDSIAVDSLGVNVPYNGEAAANIALTDGGGTRIVNEIGDLTAMVDLQNRQILPASLNVTFENIAGGTQDLAIRNSSSSLLLFTSGNFFSGSVDTTFTNSSGADNLTSDAGTIKGAFFGNEAQEIGGNFQATGESGSESVSVGGIFLGKRP